MISGFCFQYKSDPTIRKSVGGYAPGHITLDTTLARLIRAWVWRIRRSGCTMHLETKSRIETERERRTMRIPRISIIAAFFLVSAFALQAYGGENERIGKGWYAFKGDPNRAYRLVKPKRIKSGDTYPLLLLLHGYDGRAESFTRLFDGQKGSKQWFIVTPQAPYRKRNNRTHSSWIKGLDGIYLTELLESLKSRHPIDEKRIAVAGYSAGASMAAHLVKTNPGRFFKLGLIAGGSAGLRHAEVPPASGTQAGKGASLKCFEGMEIFLLGAQNDRHFNAGRVQAMERILQQAGAAVTSEVVPGADPASVYSHAVQVARWIFK